MGYVVAGYAVSFVTLALYSLRVVRRRRALERLWR
jgi:CcmD family protein